MTTQMMLMCPLTDAERSAMAIQLAELETEHGRILTEKREALAGYRDRIAGVKSRMGEISVAVLAGEEERPVEVRFERQDSDILTFREDTGALVDRRPMTEEQKQETLFENIVGDLDKPAERVEFHADVVQALLGGEEYSGPNADQFEFYEVVEADPETGETRLRHRATGATYHLPSLGEGVDAVTGVREDHGVVQPRKRRRSPKADR